MPTYAPSMDMGSYVVIVNAEKVTVSGNKFNDKMYRRHTGRPGSLKEETFKKLQAVRRSSSSIILLGALCLPVKQACRTAVALSEQVWKQPPLHRGSIPWLGGK